MSTLTVLVADDHPLYRDGLADLLESRGFAVVARAATGSQAVALARELRPDVIVMDLQLPELDGYEATRLIMSADADARIVVLSMFEDDDAVAAAIAAGASGYLVKGAAQDEIVRAVEAVAAGQAVFGTSIAASVLRNLRHETLATAGFADLTSRETEILELLANGAQTGVIARRLGVSPKTVRNHVSSILTKLGAADRVEAVLKARAAGLGGR